MILRLQLLILALVLGSGCSQQSQELSIPFVVEFKGSEITCGTLESGIVLSDLRFYVSAPQVIGADGRKTDISFVADGNWQRADIALLDFENGTQSCDNGTTELNTALRVHLPGGAHRGLIFTIGVPFEQNHKDPLLAQAPLDDSAMHWHWRAGYKFLRAGVGSPVDGFWIHLGSTGCEGTVQNISGCSSPNRVTVELSDFVPGKGAIVVDLSALTEGTALGNQTPSDCSSGPAEEACAAPFAALGLETSTGPGAQTVFNWREIK